MAPTLVVLAVFALTALLPPFGCLLFVQPLLLASLWLEAVVTPVANFFAVVTFVTAKAPACRLHGRASTGSGLRTVVVGAGQVVGEDIVNCLSVKILLIVLQILSRSKSWSQ